MFDLLFVLKRRWQAIGQVVNVLLLAVITDQAECDPRTPMLSRSGLWA
jgi:hypothetical protein